MSSVRRTTRLHPSFPILLLLLTIFSQQFPTTVHSFSPTTTASTPSTTILLHAKKPKKKKKKSSSTSSSSGLKGFGSTTKSSSASSLTIPIDRSKTAMEFYSFLESKGAGANLKRVALGFFPLGDGGGGGGGGGDDAADDSPKLRGIVALQKIPKGDTIIEIPYEAAWNLGKESNDPTLPGVVVLREYCRWISSFSSEEEETVSMGPYLAMLPPFSSPDVMGCTDFWTNEALQALQSPQIREETERRVSRVDDRFTSDILPLLSSDDDEDSPPPFQWSDATPTTPQHLGWASWLITSRVLTVQGEAGTNDAFRLMIPLIDMCNHDRDSPHVLSGRAVPGGMLRLVAGRTVEVGEQVNIVYGGGVCGNDRFVQDYGFLDGGGGGGGGMGFGGVPEAFGITGKILMGKRRIVEGGGGGGRPVLMPEDERERALEALGETELEEDLVLLGKGREEGMADDMRCALEYRIGVKRALRSLGYGLVMP